MSVVVGSVGSSASVVSGQVTITVGAGGVPAGAQIHLCIAITGSGASGSVADTAGNTYTVAASKNNNNSSANGAGFIFRARTVATLVNGNTIVYTLGAGAVLAAVAVLYVTGIVDAAGSDASATAAGSSTTPSVTSSAPSQQGDWFLAMVSGTSLVTSFTQDSTNAAWASPPGSVQNAAPVLGGGNVVNNASSALTYAPTLGTSDTWAALIVAYKANIVDMNSQSSMVLP